MARFAKVEEIRKKKVIYSRRNKHTIGWNHFWRSIRNWIFMTYRISLHCTYSISGVGYNTYSYSSRKKCSYRKYLTTLLSLFCLVSINLSSMKWTIKQAKGLQPSCAVGYMKSKLQSRDQTYGIHNPPYLIIVSYHFTDVSNHTMGISFWEVAFGFI